MSRIAKFFQHPAAERAGIFFWASYFVAPFILLFPTVLVCGWEEPLCDFGCQHDFGRIPSVEYRCGLGFAGNILELYLKIFGIFPRFFYEKYAFYNHRFPYEQAYSDIGIAFYLAEAIILLFSFGWLISKLKIKTVDLALFLAIPVLMGSVSYVLYYWNMYPYSLPMLGVTFAYLVILIISGLRFRAYIKSKLRLTEDSQPTADLGSRYDLRFVIIVSVVLLLASTAPYFLNLYQDATHGSRSYDLGSQEIVKQSLWSAHHKLTWGEAGKLKTLLKAAEDGDPKAQYKVGDLYHVRPFSCMYIDIDVARACPPPAFPKLVDFWTGLQRSWKIRSNAEAFKWYKQAAEQGNIIAQIKLGDFYTEQGRIRKHPDISVWDDTALHNEFDTQDNFAEALKWYVKAAEHNDSNAESHLGYLYMRDDVVQRDPNESLKWLRRAAEHGDLYLQCNLGVRFSPDIASDIDKTTYQPEHNDYKIDYEEAYYWLTLCYPQGKARENALREAVMKKLSSEQIEKIDQRIDERRSNPPPQTWYDSRQERINY